MPIDFDPRWEFWMPDAEIADVLYRDCLPDGSLGGYIGYGVEAGLRFGCGADELRFLPFRVRGGRSESDRDATRWPVTCSVCGRQYETSRVEREVCGAACRHRAEEVSRALSLRGRGHSMSRIADDLGVPCDTVSRWLGRAGLGGVKPEPLPSHVRERALELSRAGHFPTKIAAEVGASVPTVKRWIRKHRAEQEK